MLKSDNKTQISSPVLPAVEGSLRFSLLLALLQWCDKHAKCKPNNHKHNNKSKEKLPTRLLYVGNPDSFGYNPDFLKLVPGSEIGAATYVALSHCWGEPDKVPPYCTTQGNISDRQVKLSIAELPLTFRDAVKVARGLKVQYLWIDSLCIMQGKGGDWKEESKRMEDVPTSPYCAIAATRAVDSHAGFLKRDIKSEYVCVQDDLGRPLYVCTCPVDLTRRGNKHGLTIEHGSCKKGSCLAEPLILAPTKCIGNVVRSILRGSDSIEEVRAVGTSSKLICANLDILLLSSDGKKQHFRLDPKFPDLLFQSGFSSSIYFLRSLVDYSNRGLSKKNRQSCCVVWAIGPYCTSSRWLPKFRHLRIISSQKSSLAKIRPDGADRNWAFRSAVMSWMAYTGGIEFMDDAHGKLEVFKNLWFSDGDRKTLVTNVWEFRNCYLKEEVKLGAARRQILESRGMERGWIMYDVEDEKDLRQRQSVVVGVQVRTMGRRAMGWLTKSITCCL